MTLIRFLRYWLPALVCLSGLVVAAVRGFDDTGLDAAGALFGAGGSIWLMNVLLRVGIVGDRERDDEDEARTFFDRHGMWPDEVPPGWTPPADEPPPPARPRTGHKPPTSGGPGSRRGHGGRGR